MLVRLAAQRAQEPVAMRLCDLEDAQARGPVPAIHQRERPGRRITIHDRVLPVGSAHQVVVTTTPPLGLEQVVGQVVVAELPDHDIGLNPWADPAEQKRLLKGAVAARTEREHGKARVTAGEHRPIGVVVAGLHRVREGIADEQEARSAFGVRETAKAVALGADACAIPRP
jgi:hypothetical protein